MPTRWNPFRLALTRPVLAIGGALALSGCVETGQKDPLELALQSCLRSTGAPGTYTANQREIGPAGVPVVRAAAGGTLRGEVLMNACVEARMTRSTSAVTLIDQPVKPVAAKTRNVGGLPLPTEYPLLPGDPELWNSLTRAQQERALRFLKAGSTIRSSLGSDP